MSGVCRIVFKDFEYKSSNREVGRVYFGARPLLDFELK
jgi:hypothetical protein